MAKTNSALWRPLLRQLHIYLSVFIAPTLIFFAVTGAFQTFRIPDQKSAPILLQKLAHVHRDDMFMVPPPRPPAEAHKAKVPVPPKPAPKISTTVLKWFFVTASIIMVLTTLLGLWMALAYSRDRWLLWWLLIAGTAAPILMLLL